jgi:response regulator RpfG family c-di-GMP phosphodiesterase
MSEETLPKKKSKEELARSEQAIKIELLHILRSIARDRKSSPVLRLRVCDRIAAILGVLSPDIIDKYVRKRISIDELKSKTTEESGETEDLEAEKAEIAAWLSDKTKEEKCQSSFQSTDPKLTGSLKSTIEADSTFSSTTSLATPCATSLT